MKRFLVITTILISVLLVLSACQTVDEEMMYQQAMDNANPDEKIALLEQFVNAFPQSGKAERAYFTLFKECLSAGNSDKALNYAIKYLGLFPRSSNMTRYNSVAWTLAEYKTGMDSADVWAARGVEMARITNPRYVPMILDTYAYVKYQKGETETAEKLQEEAIIGNEEDPEYLYRLGLYQYANDKHELAYNTMVRAILFGGGETPSRTLRGWAAVSEAESAAITAVVRSVVKAYTGKGAGINEKSAAATLLARTGTDLDQAEKWAGEAVANADKNKDPREMLDARSTLAGVYFEQEKFDQVVETIKPVAGFATPYERNTWYQYGTALYRLGENEQAVSALCMANLWSEDPRSLAVLNELGYMESKLARHIEKTRTEVAEFDPGTAGDDGRDRTVLVELFTGAQCGPCKGSDLAVDKLAEYFSREQVAILEYHLHIPQPDPMTNADSEERYQYYGANFGTPTIWFNGGGKMVGGGSEIVTRSMFNTYRAVIENTPKKSSVRLSGSAMITGDDVTVNVEVAGNPDNLNLLLALAEKSVEYEGSNGIKHHAWVVRDLITASEGDPAKPGAQVYQANIANIRAEIAKYLADFVAEPPARFKGFGGWNTKPEVLKPGNLAVVAWLQNPQTKEIVQSLVIETDSAIAAK